MINSLFFPCPGSNGKFGNVPPLVQQAYEAWQKHTPKQIDFSSPFAGLSLMSQTLTELVDITYIEPENNALKQIILDIAKYPDGIMTIDRKMFVSHGGPTCIDTEVTKNYNIKSNLCFGDMTLKAKYTYKSGKIELFMMEIDMSESVLDHNSFIYFVGDETPSKTRKEQKVLLLILPEMFDILYDTRMGTKTPEWKDFIATDLRRHYANMTQYCEHLKQRIHGKQGR